MLDSIYHMTLKLLKKHFLRENVEISPSFTQRLLHGVSSLPDATSCDKYIENPHKMYTQKTINNRITILYHLHQCRPCMW